MKCWICEENEANSREHTIKRSDLNALYPKVSQSEPIRKRRDGVILKPIGSTKSNGFKYESVICNDCNNNRTQKYDKSWELLSKYIKQNWLDVRQKNGFDLHSVFAEKAASEMLNVQLFFIKLVGCKLKECTAEYDLSSFSKALRETREHPCVYLAFSESENGKSEKYCASSDVLSNKDPDTGYLYMHWFYVIGNLTVSLVYNEDQEDAALHLAQKPSEMDSFCSLVKLHYDQSSSVAY